MDPTQRFSNRAGAYGAHRPEYPAAAIDALLRGLPNERDLVVADVGAGTGIAARLLAARVASVIAVEPNDAMRERAEPVENITWCGGTAEQTGLPDKSVDVAAAFQAFHWFDPIDAFREFRRIARKRIGMLQYERNAEHPFSAAYGAIVKRYAIDATEQLRACTLDVFATLAGGAVRRAVVPFTQPLDLEGLLGRLASISYVPHEGEQGEALRREVRSLFERFERRGAVDIAMNAFILAVDV